MTMGAVDVIRQSFEMIKENPIIIVPYIALIILIGIIGILLVVSLLPKILATVSAIHVTSISASSALHLIGSLVGGSIASIAAAVIIIWLISILFTGAYISLAKQIMGKKSADLRSAFHESASRYWSLLGASIINFVLRGGAALVFFGLAIVSIPSSVPMAVLLILVGIIAEILLLVLVFESYAVVMIEGKGALDAVRKSFSIGRSKFWSLLGIFVLLLAIALIIGALRLIPILGPVIAFLCDSVLAIMGMTIPAVFYYTMVSKKKSTRTRRRRR